MEGRKEGKKDGRKEKGKKERAIAIHIPVNTEFLLSLNLLICPLLEDSI
jgi:hypothetical protein